MENLEQGGRFGLETTELSRIWGKVRQKSSSGRMGKVRLFGRDVGNEGVNSPRRLNADFSELSAAPREGQRLGVVVPAMAVKWLSSPLSFMRKVCGRTEAALPD